MPNLTPKQQRFVEEYLLDLNATQAAIRAGYAARSADVTGSRLLGNAKVAAAVAAAQADRSERVEITQDRVLQELAVIGFSSVEHYTMGANGSLVLTPDAPPFAMRAVSSVKRKRRTYTDADGNEEVTDELEFRLWDKNTALANVGKHLGMFKDGAGLIDVSTWEEPEFLERVARGEDAYKVAADRMRWLAEQRSATG